MWFTTQYTHDFILDFHPLKHSIHRWESSIVKEIEPHDFRDVVIFVKYHLIRNDLPPAELDVVQLRNRARHLDRPAIDVIDLRVIFLDVHLLNSVRFVW